MGRIDNPERYVKAALCSHAKVRSQGGVSGQEARAARWDCSTPARTPKALRQIRQPSAITAGERGLDGLTDAERRANQLILERAAAENQAHDERCQQKWQAKQRRLQTPSSGREICISGSMLMPY
jgi:hypothetical protein